MFSAPLENSEEKAISNTFMVHNCIGIRIFLPFRKNTKNGCLNVCLLVSNCRSVTLLWAENLKNIYNE